MLYNHHSKKGLRKELRNRSTRFEKILWKRLQNSKTGYKFRRQQGIGPYIVDFYCSEKKLVIELDGLQHEADTDYDTIRTEFLSGLGHRVIRFWNHQIEENIEKVLQRIKKELELILPPAKEGARGWY